VPLYASLGYGLDDMGFRVRFPAEAEMKYCMEIQGKGKVVPVLKFSTTI
jgi:hypothetical protein